MMDTQHEFMTFILNSIYTIVVLIDISNVFFALFATIFIYQLEHRVCRLVYHWLKSYLYTRMPLYQISKRQLILYKESYY